MTKRRDGDEREGSRSDGIGREVEGSGGGAACAPPSLHLLQGGARPRSTRRRSRSPRRRTTLRLLRLEDADHHGNAVFVLEGERWSWQRSLAPGRQPGRLKTAAPHPLTSTPAAAKAQKTRVKGRRPKDSNKIK